MKLEPISIVRVAEFGATVIREGEDGQPLAYLTAWTHDGQAVRLHLASAHTASELSAQLLDVATSWPA